MFVQRASTGVGRAAASLFLAAAMFLPTAACAGFESLFAPSADLWDRWETHDAASVETVDHTAWDGLLMTHIMPGRDGLNRFAYGRVTGEDRAALDGYIAALAGVRVSALNRGEQLAYWINLYNALTVQVVLDHYPVDSIRDIDISPGLFTDGPWDKELVEIEGEALTLNDIEHRILRPIWMDPRIHYAVNCASIGCPNLQTKAFTGDNVETLLDAGAHAYVNTARGARFEDGQLIVSSIYAWFQEDFGGSDAGVIAHLKRYAAPELREALDGVTEIFDFRYDWDLNDALDTLG